LTGRHKAGKRHEGRAVIQWKEEDRCVRRRVVLYVVQGRRTYGRRLSMAGGVCVAARGRGVCRCNPCDRVCRRTGVYGGMWWRCGRQVGGTGRQARETGEQAGKGRWGCKEKKRENHPRKGKRRQRHPEGAGRTQQGGGEKEEGERHEAKPNPKSNLGVEVCAIQREQENMCVCGVLGRKYERSMAEEGMNPGKQEPRVWKKRRQGREGNGSRHKKGRKRHGGMGGWEHRDETERQGNGQKGWGR